MLRILCAGVLALLLAPAALIAERAHYTVMVETAQSNSLRIEATFQLEGDVIGLQITRSPQLPNGQADLLRNLEVRRHGEPLQIEALGSGDWRLADATAGDDVTVRYDILLEHGDYAWGPGIDEVAYRTNEGLFFTGASLFVVPGYTMRGGASVEFQLPETWRASVPWAMEGNVATVPTAHQLLRNCLFMGSHQTQVVELDGFRFTMVIGSDLWEQRQLFVDAMEPVLPAAKAAFGGMPRESNYLVVFNRGDRADGGAFAASYSMLLAGTVNEASGVIWGHGVAHEVIHFWNGHSFRPASLDEEWLKEGLTDYFTILVRSRSGLDSRDRVFRKLENCMRRYVLSKMVLKIESTLRESGHNKHRDRMLVYGGGALVGFALDVRIREATRNARGIDDFLAAMFEEFGDGANQYTFDDVVRIASAVSGQDQSKFFSDYVDGHEFLDVAPYVRAIGLQLDTVVDEFYLSLSPDATAEQTAMRVAILGH